MTADWRAGDVRPTTPGPGLAALQSRQSLREEVAQALRAAIVAGQLRPGTTYSAPTLATQFGVSPTPVREAILDLAKEGLVTIVKNKGFRIRSLSERELDEITEMRELLEIPVVAGQVGRLSEAQLRELSALAEAIVTAAGRGDVVAYIEADNEFHLSLLRAGGNLRLVDTVADLRSRTRLYGLDALVESGQLVASANEHVELAKLLAAGDREAVVDLMRRHLRHVRGIWAARPER
ncbi:transcriptional regulator, GntR family [Micromonospora citrea]|uniref:Transcriptional regulator, GntR family n=1 Tax=Micromonospora citrea TaxID=47855 RepID=A0A1C6TRD0_9ACTN|nr:GntR family transcriptional regulator [Micromonospora citrea]SCL44340.1 transcriptional regulator, GntR family [Micromonospora citrea]